MKKLTSIVAAALLAALILSSCGGNAGTSSTPAGSSSTTASEPAAAPSSTEASEPEKITGTVSMSGSTSMEKVAKALAESFNEKYPDVAVDVQLGGSSTGIKNAQEGVSDIGNVSRDLKDTETGLTAHKIALDGIGVVINPANPVEDLTMEQIAQIYTGEITNWKDVGGDDLEISRIGREAGSGTRDGFETITDTKEACKYNQELTSTGDVITTVAGNPNAIGYASLSAVKDSVKALTVGGVAPSEETVLDGTYTIQRPFVLATRTGEALSEAAQAFFDFATSADANEIIAAAGAVPVAK